MTRRRGATRGRGTAALALMVAATAVALVAPWPAAAAIALATTALTRKARRVFLAFAALSLAINAGLFGLLVPRGDVVWTPVPALGITFSVGGAQAGLVGGLRLVAVVGANAAVLARVQAAVLLDDLPLPVRVRAFLAAVLIAVQDMADEAARLWQARRLEGALPAGRIRRVAAGALLVPPLMVAAHRRAQVRSEALRLGGHATGPSFAPLVAVTALAVAGRMVFAAVPNVAPTFLFVFLGGLLFGPLVGFLAGLLGMALTDFLLSGLVPTAFVNAPAMALLGLAGGALRRVPFGGTGIDRIGGMALAGGIGVLATFLFSVAADSMTWLVVREFRGVPWRALLGGAAPDYGAWRALVFAGAVFNVIPAVLNGVLFAVTVGPVDRAFKALRAGT